MPAHKVYKEGKFAGTKIMPTIQHGVPLPFSRSHINSNLYTAAKAMKVGDCIDIPYSRGGITANLQRATGYKFTQRKVGDTLRIWRTV